VIPSGSVIIFTKPESAAAAKTFIGTSKLRLMTISPCGIMLFDSMGITSWVVLPKASAKEASCSGSLGSGNATSIPIAAGLFPKR